ncbi:ImmA/IrrE family metallo-endopeptidase [Clostridium perfringens]|uniref:ImmA/IrrE family metallo-endopeptidase n=1 Tax=Clostridium perfringens TaxID=1502 RepID=UPI0024BBFA89|nr:ImmA/IrrE family metallo-endopeptidase [Clostridium perfringens]MDK0979393.1 ImmA/IrrE family metallo-endopeptidase [Clostridium perfringens]MDT9336922.1 ImmA/IrrE family metallo-endopeptidase [Clostridium perfringens]MDT9344678.1 ImmA/IrrE family metallo-endopeptidase [Clostridium perfringens]MDT9347921.1 ImmA/IrrE family metallo-endopeptidase [Clostridium perfringens]MDT9353615.1 ImmA/IrrE family metallo-endopeptidase [Clostridium perfringens]
MTKYEKLLNSAHLQGINVYELDLGVDIPCGKCVGNNIIINNRIKEKEKICVLLEELGHYKLNVGNITKLQDVKDVKQELLARKWSYENLIPINNLIEALSIGINSIEEITEYFNVTENFFYKAIEFYKRKYGVYFVGNNYLLYFEPLKLLNFYGEEVYPFPNENLNIKNIR